MMLLIPLVATPNQTLSVQLGGVNYQLQIAQKTTGVFMSLSQAGTHIVDSVICRDRVKLVREAYLGFSGDLCFIDTQGTNDPDYKGFGSRYVLAWLQPGIDV